jgi:PAS domain S-box-containing protein
MTQHNLRKLKAAGLWVGIAVAGVAVGWLGYRREEHRAIAALLNDARRSAVAIDVAGLRPLAGTRADLTTGAYAALKQRLQALGAVDPRVRFVYVFRAEPATGRVIFLADSAAPGAADESLPGDEYPQAAQSPGLQEILRTGEPVSEGPLADDFGTWITGYAPLGGETAPGGGGPREVLGLDIDADAWRRALWLAGLDGAFFVWVVLGLPVVAMRMTRRQGEQREVIRNLSEAMEQSHSAILIIDLGDRIEYANRGMCQQTGYSRRELIGRSWRDIRGRETPDEVWGEVAANLRAGRHWEGEWFNGRKDGSAYPVRGAVTPVKHRDGSLSCFVAVFDDVTETRRREAELREARDLAEAGDRAKGQFLATMSHEVRTPLNGIVGFTSLLLDTALSPEQRDYVRTIRSSGEALMQLTGDILDYARIESGKLKLDLLACDPRDCVEDALDLLAMKAAERNLELLHHCAADVPAAVMVDGGRLRQVLVNIVGNAVKFTDQGEVEVGLRLLPSAAGGADAESGPARENRMLEFTVRDTGIGIPAAQHARLFKPFSQLDDSSTRRYGGTGLGLAISRNIVQLMGGAISVASEPGQGSTFTFTIRVTVAESSPPQRDLAGLHVGLALRPGALRRELAWLLRGWRAEVVELDSPAELAATRWEVGLVAPDEAAARELAAVPEPKPGLPPEKMVALVPVSLSGEVRAALRIHFHLLVNKPVHHGALYSLLAGTRSATPFAPPAPAHFGFRVLLVEDNPMNQRLMQRVLTNLGCTHAVVDNGRRALEELSERAGDYDLVLLDLHMPEMDGISALQEIRKGNVGPVAQSMWIIALTADAREDERSRGLAAGLDDYLTKPLRVPELQAALRRFRAERRTAPGN